MTTQGRELCMVPPARPHANCGQNYTLCWVVPTIARGANLIKVAHRNFTDIGRTPGGIGSADAKTKQPSRLMTDAAAQVQKLLRQQAAIARFGSFALRERNLMNILTEAVRVCAEGLSVPFSKVCRYRADENDLLIVAGYGWQH